VLRTFVLKPSSKSQATNCIGLRLAQHLRRIDGRLQGKAMRVLPITLWLTAMLYFNQSTNYKINHLHKQWPVLYNRKSNKINTKVASDEHNHGMLVWRQGNINRSVYAIVSCTVLWCTTVRTERNEAWSNPDPVDRPIRAGWSTGSRFNLASFSSLYLPSASVSSVLHGATYLI